MDYRFWRKYNLKITLEDDTLVGRGNPEYPNGWLLGIVRGHIPMKIRHFRHLTLVEELAVVRNLLKYGKKNERYPLIDEVGQVCIYKDQSFVYDTMLNGSVIEDESSFDGNMDDKDEEPIMVLPSEDMLGILEDYYNWKLEQADNVI